MKKINILFLSAGRRVELINSFREAKEKLGIEGKLVGVDLDELAPALNFVDVKYKVPRINSKDFIPTIIDICKKEQVICGYTCLEYDRLMKIENNVELQIGDKIKFNKIGAYSIALSPLFIEYFPKVYVKNENGYMCVRERWDIDEYIQKSYI